MIGFHFPRKTAFTGGVLLATLMAARAGPSDLPRGEIIPDVRCTDDNAQGYALYLPSGYTADRDWPVIFAFDPGGRGLNPVERYRAAAEKYGYIAAGSNNSRNGGLGSDESGRVCDDARCRRAI